MTQPEHSRGRGGESSADPDVYVVRTPGAPSGALSSVTGAVRLVELAADLAADREALDEMVADRPWTRVVHLTRHPYVSLAGAGADQRQAEDLWVVANENLLDLGDRIGPDRYLVLRAEDLTGGRVGPLLGFLGISDGHDGSDRSFEPVTGEGCAVPPQRPGRGLRALATELGYVLDDPSPEKPPADPPSAQPIRRVARPDVIPASAAQQRLLFVESLEAELAVYNLPSVRRLTGPLDRSALAAALTLVVERHEALRTDFVQVDGEWVQVVAPPSEVAVGYDDLRGRSEADVEAAVAAEVGHRFDLGAGPKVRARLLRTADDEHLLVVTLHHLVADGSSIVRLTSEMAISYAALVQGAHPALPELELQYADVTLWQLEQARAGALDAQLEHWRRRLSGPLPVLEMPADHPRPAVFEYAAGSVPVVLPAELATELRAAARAAGVTPFMFLLASFAATLARWSRADEVVVGTATANRRPETEDLVGLFTSAVPLRVPVVGSAPFSDLLAVVRSETFGALANQDVPFDRIVREVNPPRDPSRSPLYQASFVLNNMTPARAVPVEAVAQTDVTVGATAVEVDLSVVLDEAQDGFNGRLDYCAALFDHPTVERFVRSWQQLLRSAIDDVAAAVDDLVIVDPVEAELLVSGWNETDAPLPPYDRIDEWVAAQARATPDAPAVSDATTAWTHHELDEVSNRMAAHLAARGVRPGDRVGVSVERSAPMVAVLLGVLRAGAAYVPLDPAFPSERLRFMIQDARLSHVVTDDPGRDGAVLDCSDTGGHRPEVVDLVAEQDRIRAARWNASTVTEPVEDAPAYVIYTSGSTGVPKGVVIGHRSVVNFLGSMQQEPGMASDDVLVAVTTLSFDISVLELFLPLVSGASVVVASSDEALDANLLGEMLERARATVLQATPTTFAMLLEVGWSGRAGLKVLCGGEALTPELAERLVLACGEVWNMFGPTETTIWSTLAPVTEASLAVTTGPSMPIGRPIANTVCRVLDTRGSLVPVGVPGELHIGGIGLAVGYLDRPELTADRFVPDPFDELGRLYRTGDLARWRDDGTLEFLGRIDHQVKVRGHRIELGEVEAAMRAHPEVTDAVVVVDGVGSSARLGGYVIAEAGAPEDLRPWLRDRLPGYMVPSVVVAVESFPLTPNRKVDRRALPPLDPSQGAATDSAPPATDVERVVARAFVEVLGVAEVGRDDDFFELGGHSLIATALLARVSAAFGVPVRLRAFFAQPTVAGTAALLLADPVDRQRVEGVARVEERLAAMSPEQIRDMLAAKRSASGGGR